MNKYHHNVVVWKKITWKYSNHLHYDKIKKISYKRWHYLGKGFYFNLYLPLTLSIFLSVLNMINNNVFTYKEYISKEDLPSEGGCLTRGDVCVYEPIHCLSQIKHEYNFHLNVFLASYDSRFQGQWTVL